MSARHDVVILGSGLAGTLLGVILARHGVRTVLVEKGSHPRFAVGESTVPETTFHLEILSKRYDVPELGALKNFPSIQRSVTSACGVKRGFSFVHHREGEEQRPEACSQFPTWGPPFGPDVHLHRQDVDAWLLAAAIRRGADYRSRVALDGVDVGPGGVTLRVRGGERIDGELLVDASGFDSPVARALGLREDPCTLETRSRTIFTHMVGVQPYERVSDGRAQGLAYAYSETTLHHLFPGGWFWIIPFDNHAGATNPLCSVGLSVDLDRWPASGAPAEEEFWSFVRRFPSVERHLRGARAVRDWVSTGRLQYSSRGGRADRVFLLPHAAGFVDALFSGGLTQTVTTVNNLAGRVLEAARARDWSSERFAYPETWMLRGIRHHDRLVSRAYWAMQEPELFDAWHRVWMLGSTFGATGHVEVVARWDRTRDPAVWSELERPPRRGAQSADIPEFQALFGAASEEMDRHRRGERSAGEASAEIRRLVGACPLAPPRWRLGDPATRCPTTFTLPDLAALSAWGFWSAPESVRRNFDLRGRIAGALGAVAGAASAEARKGLEGALGVVTASLSRGRPGR